MMDAREQAIEILAKANYYRSMPLPIKSWESLSDDDYDKQKFWGYAASDMSFLLAARQEEPCPTCLGTHTLRLEHGSTQCPNCTDGRVPGAPLVILGPRAIVLAGGNYPPEGGPTVYCDDARAQPVDQP